jgi:hypothetical protein
MTAPNRPSILARRVAHVRLDRNLSQVKVAVCLAQALASTTDPCEKRVVSRPSCSWKLLSSRTFGLLHLTNLT